MSAKSDWLSKVKDIKASAIKAREQASVYEKLPRLDLRELKGTLDDPAVIQVTAASERREVKTDRMEKPMTVFDAEVTLSSDEAVKPGKYAIWENTSVLHNEMCNYAKDYGVNGDVTGKTFNIAYFGRTPSKKRRNISVHVFKVIPQDE